MKCNLNALVFFLYGNVFLRIPDNTLLRCILSHFKSFGNIPVPSGGGKKTKTKPYFVNYFHLKDYMCCCFMNYICFMVSVTSLTCFQWLDKYTDQARAMQVTLKTYVCLKNIFWCVFNPLEGPWQNSPKLL